MIISMLKLFYKEFQSLETVPEKIDWLKHKQQTGQLVAYDINVQNLISHWQKLI